MSKKKKENRKVPKSRKWKDQLKEASPKLTETRRVRKFIGFQGKYRRKTNNRAKEQTITENLKNDRIDIKGSFELHELLVKGIEKN